MTDLRTINGIRNMLTDEMVKVIDGTSTPANLNALVNASGKLFSSIKLEIEYNKAVGKTPYIPMLGDEKEKAEQQKKLEAVKK
jgi:hypothetical protein